MPRVARTPERTAERVVPYDSPKRNFGEFQRLKLCQIALDKLRERVGVLVDAPEVFGFPRADDAPVATPGHVDEDEVGLVEQAVTVVEEPIRRPRSGSRIAGADPDRTERSHTQPNGGTAGAAVIQKRYRSMRRVGTVQRVGGVEYPRGGLIVAVPQGDRASARRVAKAAPFQLDGVTRDSIGRESRYWRRRCRGSRPRKADEQREADRNRRARQ